MSGIDQWTSGLESANGVSPLILAGGVLSAGVLVVALVMMARGRRVKIAPPHSEPVMSQSPSRFGIAWPVAIVIASLAIAWVLTVRPGGDLSAARRSFETRAAELTMRALAPGSPLACLDAVGSAAVEAVCEKSLFSSPETLAAALAYVDARLSLFVEGSEMGRNSGAGDSFERLRRAIETDRYGLVAHVLTTRGCDADNCPTLKLLRDDSHVLANLKDRTFDANVVLHAGTWRSDVSSLAAAPATAPTLASVPPAPMPPASTSTAPAAPTPSSPSKFEFPSSASIPAVSIMSPEPPPPAAPKAAEQPTAPAPAAKPTASRRQSARETTNQAPGRPVQIAPSNEPPAPAGTLANPGAAR
ncbi:MAG: hypothetical protein AB1490_14060 [Pseudomonadota bacterium]